MEEGLSPSGNRPEEFRVWRFLSMESLFMSLEIGSFPKGIWRIPIVANPGQCEYLLFLAREWQNDLNSNSLLVFLLDA